MTTFDGYESPAGTYDEMFDGGAVRPAYRELAEALSGLSTQEVRTRADYLSSTYLDRGITFAVGGNERPFPLDIVPRIIEAERWRGVEAGLVQRVRALEAFLDDVYGQGRIFDEGIIPRRVVTTSPHFHRVVHGFRPPGGVRIHVCGTDLVRDAEGTFRVLEDNVRIPSGVSYVMTNRAVMGVALPEAVASYRISPVHGYPRMLLSALEHCAPDGVADPTVVVLTPGVHNSAYFEHALLARLMGVELVEGRDLVCRDGHVWTHTTTGLAPVHVIYRRVDDDFLDPVHFRGDSLLGCAGLVNAARAGNVTIANAIGNGVADDKLVYTYVPDFIRYYLGEEPLIPGVDTWRLEEPESRKLVLDRLTEMVVKPVDGSGGKGIVIGSQASREELEALRRHIIASPRGWIAQPIIQLSTVPTLVGDHMAPRHVDLRPFIVNDGNQPRVLAGGLTRVALPEGKLVVNSSQGGGSKDTWVLADPDARVEFSTVLSLATPKGAARECAGAQEEVEVPLEVPALLEEGRQQQQQQQQQAPAGPSVVTPPHADPAPLAGSPGCAAPVRPAENPVRPENSSSARPASPSSARPASPSSARPASPSSARPASPSSPCPASTERRGGRHAQSHR
ncbi:circularly permuted type 2 ATP-grasp protein [Actinomyces polynesiensis]|uniref:circularly permuted type 2 ATP-grasp protein n=1 Tax=Actinomyces polynesiensis TaxID=1325934 RepID=UPI000A556284|nr:circularly permuted type 2 ATP-grasp protein [Actinomyces polynesiensis]